MSRAAMGVMEFVIQSGAMNAGTRSVTWRSSLNDREPSPMTTPACSTAVGTPDASRISPTRTREAWCSLISSPSGCRPSR